MNAAELRLDLARLADAPRVARMSRALIEHGLTWRYTPPAIAARILDPNSDVLLARRGARLAGFAVMEFDFDERRAHLVLLAVDPAERRRGVGSALVCWLESVARAGGIRALALEVRATNAGARSFYQRLGFSEVGVAPGYYESREDAVRLSRPLALPCATSASRASSLEKSNS